MNFAYPVSDDLIRFPIANIRYPETRGIFHRYLASRQLQSKLQCGKKVGDLTKNLHRDIFHPSTSLFSSPCSVVNMAVLISVPGQIMLLGLTNHWRVRPANV